MYAIVLAAGKGTRLRPLTNYLPKCLIPVRGKPVLDYIVENLEKCDKVEEVFVAVSHLKDTVDLYLDTREYKVPVKPIQVLGWETGGDLRACLEEINKVDDFIVCNGDLITNVNVTELVNYHSEKVKEFDVISTDFLFKVDEDHLRFGLAKLEENGLISGFYEKPKEWSHLPLVNAGYYVNSKEIFEEIDKYLPSKKSRLENTQLAVLAEEGKLAGYYLSETGGFYWYDIGTIQQLLEAESMLYNKEGVIPPPLPCKEE